MKIVTWNINGIRAASREKPLKKVLDELEADVVCLQETKVTRDQLDEVTAIVEGYNSYFSYSKVKSGYSGVANFCRDAVTPIAAEEGLSPLLTSKSPIGCYDDLEDFTDSELESLDAEGRCVLTEHKTTSGDSLVIINVYCPRAERENEERMKFKLRFYELLKRRSKALLAHNKKVIILGDINVSLKMIDHCDPGEQAEFDENPSRQWLNSFLLEVNEKLDTHAFTEVDNARFVDSFRYFYPTQRDAYTCWCTVTGARQTNYGTRLDYIFPTLSYLRQEFTDCIIRPEVEGSDHCPVVATLRCDCVPADKPPLFCTKYMPEFAGTQQKLSMFFKSKMMPVDTKLESNEQPKVVMELAARDASPRFGGGYRTGDSSAFRVDQFIGSPRESKPLSKSCTQETSKISSSQQKRLGSLQVSAPNKRLKTSKSAEGKTLLNFFGKTNSSSSSALDVGNFTCKEEFREKDLETKSQDVEESRTDSPQSSGDSSPSCSPDTPAAPPQEKKSNAALWKSILRGPAPVPLCSGHKEACVKRTVKNKGPNHGKQFYCCARGEGHASNPEARCNFFKWTS